MPVERIGLEQTVATALSRMGLRTLGQVQALPRQTLARRFEAQVLKHLDTLLGERPLALGFYLPPDRFDVRIELNFDVHSHQALLFPLRRLTGDLSAFLCGRDSGVQRFDLHLEHAGLPDTLIKVGLLSAERDPAMLFELARGRLEQVQVEAPVRGFRLSAQDLPSFVPQRRELFEERPQQSLPWEQLRERLRAWQVAKALELPLIIGSEMRIENGPKLVLLVESLEGYQALCRLITHARRRTEKGQYRVLREDFSEPLPGLLALWVPDTVDAPEHGAWLKGIGHRQWRDLRDP